MTDPFRPALPPLRPRSAERRRRGGRASAPWSRPSAWTPAFAHAWAHTWVQGWAQSFAPRALAAVSALLLGLGAAAPASACGLGLVLALDVSSSVDAEEYALQAKGLAEALADAEVQEAILAGDPVRIAIYEWSGRWKHALIADWVELTSPDEIDRLAATVRAATRSHADFPTALGHAIGFASGLLRDATQCDRRVIDISGDGANNDGYEPPQAYVAFDLDEVTVNALVVGGIARPQLVRYFETMVLHGPDAFVEIADDYRDYARAMKRKLLREIRPPLAIGLAPVDPAPGRGPEGPG